MSTLVIQIPPRPRALTHIGTESTVSLDIGTVFSYVLSSDGVTPSRHGDTTLDLLPQADSVIAVLPMTDVSWHSMVIPKAPAARMSAALAGALEEVFLDDVERLHISLPPQYAAGEVSWVAATDVAWLSAVIQFLDAARSVDRVVPMLLPSAQPAAYFHESPHQSFASHQGDSAMWVTWTSIEGVSSFPVVGQAIKQWAGATVMAETQFSATPAVAAPAERWLNAPVTVKTVYDLLWAAAQQPWNLRQFGLAPRHRGWVRFTNQLKQFKEPRWRSLRWGLVCLVLLNVIGLNAWAYQKKHALEQRRAAMSQLLRETFPSVTGVLDAPAQMKTQTEARLALAGELAPTDLESLLGAAAAAWPREQPVTTLQFEAGRLTLAASGWSPEQMSAFQQTLRTAGWTVVIEDGRLMISPATGGQS